MGTITAEAALTLIRENDPSPIGRCDMLAGSRDVGEDGSTYTVISSIRIIDPFFVIDRVIKLLSFNCMVHTVDDIGLVKAYVVRVIISRWCFGLEVENDKEYQQ